MHDEDRITHYGKVHKSKDRASLEALSWAADRAGKSYGAFIAGLVPGDESRIQAEFEAEIRTRLENLARRRAEKQKREKAASTDQGYIITEVDP